MSHQFAPHTQTHSLTVTLSLMTDVSLHNHQQHKYRGYLQQHRQSDSVAVVTRPGVYSRPRGNDLFLQITGSNFRHYLIQYLLSLDESIKKSMNQESKRQHNGS